MSPSLVPPSLTLPGPYQAVVFDMDGLLVHTEKQWLEAKTELFRRHGLALSAEDRAAVFGADDLSTSTYFTERFGLGDEYIADIQREYLEIFGDLIDRGVETTAGATVLIDRLRGRVPIALASNTRRSLVERILHHTPFGRWFDGIATGDEVPPKPAPDVYLLACERVGTEPATAVAVEDSPTGVRAAQAAGLVAIGVPSDDAHPLPQADHQVGSLSELL